MKSFIVPLTLCLLLSVSCQNNRMKSEKAVYEGENISKEASIIRDKESKAASLTIRTNGKWTLYGGPSVEKIDFSHPVAEGENSGTFALPVPDSVRSYFQLITPAGKAILAESHLPMSGGYNFRDLGGIRMSDGRYVKWGKIFRGDELHTLTDADLKYLSSIPLISVVDFRSEQEMKMTQDKNPPSVKKNYHYSINPGNLMEAASGIDPDRVTAHDMDSLMMALNRSLVTQPESIERYKNFFDLLEDENQIPLLFHCTAGKDRTGMAAALVLYTLGADDETVMNDYLLSNRYLESKYGKLSEEYAALKPLLSVKPEFLRAGIDQIRKDHGSIDHFLRNILEVDLQKMKSMYLY